MINKKWNFISGKFKESVCRPFRGKLEPRVSAGTSMKTNNKLNPHLRLCPGNKPKQHLDCVRALINASARVFLHCGRVQRV